MSAQSLRDELLAVAGVAEVELDGEAGSPAGVKIRLEAGADAERVGVEVQRVLAGHGMRSRVDAGALPPTPPLPAVAPAPPPEEAAVAAPPAAPGAQAGLRSVRVEESATGLEVTVTGLDGRQATRRAPASEDGLTAAVVEAVGVLVTGSTPRLVSVDWTTANGSQVVTLVLEVPGGLKGAGAGLVRASRGYALARAAWSALLP